MKRKVTKTDRFLAGLANDYFSTPAGDVLLYLLLHPGFHTPEEIASATKIYVQLVNRALYEMVDWKVVELYIPMRRIETDRKYYWRSDRKMALSGFLKYFSSLRERYGELLEYYRIIEPHFTCENIDVFLDFHTAAEYNFMCPDGTIMKEYSFDDEKKLIEEKIESIFSMEKEIIRYSKRIKR